MKEIFIKSAKTNNLKSIDLSIPKGKFIVVTGVSGSGKSSLTIDTLYAEGQRKYIESMSSYARQFLKRLDKPDVAYIQGLCPAISIEQKVIATSSRSTVGTMSEVFEYLRLFYGRLGKTYSPKTNLEIKKHEVSDVLALIKSFAKDTKSFVGWQLNLSELKLETIQILISKGYSRGYFRQAFFNLEDWSDKLPKFQKNDLLYLVVERFVISEALDEDNLKNLADTIQTVFQENNGDAVVHDLTSSQTFHFNNKFEDEFERYEIPSPQMFNFNNAYGACSSCEGTGITHGISEDLVIPNKSLSVYEGCVVCWKTPKMSKYQKDFIDVAREIDFPIHRPYIDLTQEEKDLLWHGNQNIQGIFQFFEMIWSNQRQIEYRVLYSRYRGKTVCRDCKGSRLRKDAQYVKIGGKSIVDLVNLSLENLLSFFKDLQLDDFQTKVGSRLIFEITNRLEILISLGLGYLTLNRESGTLSGGESQRINLARVIGSSLTDSLYILDEPSIGLHPRDTDNLVKVLLSLRDLNNTVIVVEHEERIMRASDYLIDIGPKAGIHGGEVVFAGNFADIFSSKSLTAQYLNGDKSVMRKFPKIKPTKFIDFSGITHHNLVNVSVSIPLNAITVVSGVSGSGKTSLIRDVIYPVLANKVEDNQPIRGYYESVQGDFSQFHIVEMVNQQSLGKSSRSIPVTYTKAYDYIRDLFASQVLSARMGLEAKDFSFNVPGGRCETCQGDGSITVEMQFLADVTLECEACQGKKFQDHVLEVSYKGKNIFDVLSMNIDEALVFFEENATIYDRILPLQQVGLGYLSLGQNISSLSGGEAQRVKLASYMIGHLKQKVFFIFDEPTTGLHFEDVQQLMNCFEFMVQMGHTIVIVEHNLDVIRNADWNIDLGPQAGNKGGQIMYQGPCDKFASCQNSLTASFL
ncbi:MAG: excinuclease ABC subunit UvrA [Chitinophagales bacterium]|jgi:excinuclease ABC subunit A|nr:excinuclease ABC subunit UvrA [Chitinophagales bacterium]